jgi:hypothetical protein
MLLSLVKSRDAFLMDQLYYHEIRVVIIIIIIIIPATETI